jgi:hypothetical protein
MTTSASGFGSGTGEEGGVAVPVEAENEAVAEVDFGGELELFASEGTFSSFTVESPPEREVVIGGVMENGLAVLFCAAVSDTRECAIVR